MSARPANILPVGSCLLAATLWGMLWFPLRELEAHGLPGLWATLAIYIGALCALLPWLWSRRIGFIRQIGAQPLNLLVIAAAAGWCNLAFILALLDGTVVRVLLLFYLAPMWTVVLGWLILGERPDRAAGVTLLLAMSGALVMLWPSETSSLSAAFNHADALALSAGFGFALNNVMIRRSGYLAVGFKMLAAWSGVLILTIAAILLLGRGWPVASSGTWLSGLLVGLLGMSVMTFAAQYGVTHLPVYRSAVIFLFEIVAGAASAWLLSDETIATREWLGGTLVMLAAWQSARTEWQREAA